MRSSKTGAIIFSALAILCVAGLVRIWNLRFANKKDEMSVRNPMVKVEEPAPTPSIPVTNADHVYPRPTGMLCDEKNVICINSSYAGMLLASPFSVTGTWIGARTVDALIELQDANGSQILAHDASWSATSTKDEQHAFAVREFLFDVPTSTEGNLLIHVVKEGGVNNLERYTLQIPVRLPTRSFTVFFYRVGLANEPREDGYACPEAPLKVLEKRTRMLAYTALPIEATLRAALQEISYGGLKEFSVRDGVATLTFEHEANGELSSCLAQQHEATIQETLKQFSSVKRVEFIRETK